MLPLANRTCGTTEPKQKHNATAQSDLEGSNSDIKHESWMTGQRKPWECRLDQLDGYLQTMKESDDDNGK